MTKRIVRQENSVMNPIREAMMLEVPQSAISGLRDLFDPSIVFLEFAAQRGGFLTFIVCFHEYTSAGAIQLLEVNYVSGLDMFTANFLKDLDEYDHSLYLQVPPEINGSRYLKFHIIEKIYRYYARERQQCEFYIETLEGETVYTVRDVGPMDHCELIYTAL